MNITFRDYEEKDFHGLKEMIFALYAEDPEGEPMTEAKIKATVNESLLHPEKVKLIMICTTKTNPVSDANTNANTITNADDNTVTNVGANTIANVDANTVTNVNTDDNASDEKVIGYGIIVMFWSNEFGGNIVNIDELYVKEAYRNKQIATRFITHQKTAYPNSAALQLEATPSNDTAMRLYKRLGFELSANSHLMLVL